MPHPTIEEARRVQDHFGYQEFHVAYVVPGESFVLAHTDDERAKQDSHPLRECPIHIWMVQEEIEPSPCCFREPGWYLITDLHDAIGLAF